MAETTSAPAAARRAKASQASTEDPGAQAAAAAALRAAEVLAQAEKASAALAASLAAAEARIAKLSAETTAALKARDAALAEAAEAVAARVKEAEAAAGKALGDLRAAGDAAGEKVRAGAAEALGDLRTAADAAGEKVRAGAAEALGVAEASFARLAAQVDAAEEATRQAIALPAAGATAMAENMTRARKEVSDFVSERIRQDIATQGELLGCRSLGEVSAVQSRFFRTAMDQYVAEAGKLARLMVPGASR